MKKAGLRSAKEIAYLSLFLALVIGGQYAFAVIPGVEVVTVLFVSYSFCMGENRGMVAATAFSFLRQFVFGVFLNVLVLYLIYFNFLSFVFGRLGARARKTGKKNLAMIVFSACFCTLGFTLLDNFLTPLMYGYSKRAMEAYFWASLSFAIPQVLFTLLTCGYLFLPLEKVFSTAAKNLKN